MIKPVRTDLFGPMMQPLTHQAQQLQLHFARWLVAELHELGFSTIGLGPIDPKWRMLRFTYAKEMLCLTLTQEQIACCLARTFFGRGKPRTVADAYLCWLLAYLAWEYGVLERPFYSDEEVGRRIAARHPQK